MSRRKHKRKTKKKRKRICCVGPGCPEWLHCINVLGDPSQGIKPKTEKTLKIIKRCAKKYSTYKNTNYKKCLKKERKKLNKKRKTRRKRGGATIVNPSNVAELKEILIRNGVSQDDMSTWSKSPSKLLNEIKTGETTLITANNQVRRIVNSVRVKIYNNQTKAYSLYEIGHLDKNKNLIKTRSNEGVLEKMMSNEEPQQALKRAISEELGSNYVSNIRYMKGAPAFDIEKATKDPLKDSYSYPGLPTQYSWFTEEIFIPDLTVQTLYNNPPKITFLTKELKDDGSFKRFILWEWKEQS